MNLFSPAKTITREANSHGYFVVPSICGHGIGRDFHEYPEIMHSCKLTVSIFPSLIFHLRGTFVNIKIIFDFSFSFRE